MENNNTTAVQSHYRITANGYIKIDLDISNFTEVKNWALMIDNLGFNEAKVELLKTDEYKLFKQWAFSLDTFCIKIVCDEVMKIKNAHLIKVLLNMFEMCQNIRNKKVLECRKICVNTLTKIDWEKFSISAVNKVFDKLNKNMISELFPEICHILMAKKGLFATRLWNVLKGRVLLFQQNQYFYRENLNNNMPEWMIADMDIQSRIFPDDVVFNPSDIGLYPNSTRMSVYFNMFDFTSKDILRLENYNLRNIEVHKNHLSNCLMPVEEERNEEFKIFITEESKMYAHKRGKEFKLDKTERMLEFNKDNFIRVPRQMKMVFKLCKNIYFTKASLKQVVNASNIITRNVSPFMIEDCYIPGIENMFKRFDKNKVNEFLSLIDKCLGNDEESMCFIEEKLRDKSVKGFPDKCNFIYTFEEKKVVGLLFIFLILNDEIEFVS